MADISHVYGGYLSLDSQGNLVMVSGVEETNQRIYRRVFTNPASAGAGPDFIQEPTYGLGLGCKVGTPITLGQISAAVAVQMQLESDVDPTVVPTTQIAQSVDKTTNTITITYQSLGTGDLVSASYTESGDT